MIGTGIFATPSTIFELSGSVGLALFIWVAGMIIAAAGMAVYLEFGTAIPRNGGEKNYLEYVYRKPKFLVTGFYTGYVVLLGKTYGMDRMLKANLDRLGGFKLRRLWRIYSQCCPSRGQPMESKRSWPCMHNDSLPGPWNCLEMGASVTKPAGHYQTRHYLAYYCLWFRMYSVSFIFVVP